MGFPGVQLVKNLLGMWETWVQSLGREDPLEKGMATHSSILAWRIPWGHKESDMTEQLSLSFHFTIRLRRTIAISYTMSQVITKLTLIQEFLYSPRKIKENS